MKPKIYFGFIFALLAVSLTGVTALTNYSSRPGEASNAELSWPKKSKLSHSKEFRLVMFIHPGCPCSKASLEELTKITSPEVETTVVILEDPMFKDLLKNNPLIKKASAMKNVSVVIDHDGHEAKLFGAKTSGATFLYSTSTLAFSGGITPGRGHVGESEGLVLLRNKLNKKDNSGWLSRVYGCGLFSGKKS